MVFGVSLTLRLFNGAGEVGEPRILTQGLRVNACRGHEQTSAPCFVMSALWSHGGVRVRSAVGQGQRSHQGHLGFPSCAGAAMRLGSS